jgi:hypothetical protein
VQRRGRRSQQAAHQRGLHSGSPKATLFITTLYRKRRLCPLRCQVPQCAVKSTTNPGRTSLREQQAILRRLDCGIAKTCGARPSGRSAPVKRH